MVFDVKPWLSGVKCPEDDKCNVCKNVQLSIFNMAYTQKPRFYIK